MITLAVFAASFQGLLVQQATQAGERFIVNLIFPHANSSSLIKAFKVCIWSYTQDY